MSLSRQRDATIDVVQFGFNRLLHKRLTREKSRGLRKRQTGIDNFRPSMRTSAALKGEIQPRQAPRRETFPTFHAFVTGTRGIINGVHAPRNDAPGQIGADCTFT